MYKEVPIDETLFTDVDVFEALHLDHPGLEDVKKSYENGDIESAKKALVSYYYNRTSVNYLFDYRYQPLKKLPDDVFPFFFQASLGIKSDIKQFCLSAGRKLMDNIYVMPGNRGEFDLGENFSTPLHYNFLSDQSKGNRGAFSIFSRGQFFEYLMFLYHETGDEKVVRQFERVLDFFWNTYPLYVVNTSPDAGRLQFTEDRDVMNLGWLCIVYIGMLYSEMLYQTDTNHAFGLIKHLLFAGMQFCRFEEDKYRKYNHHYFERGIAPFFLGMMLPEFKPFDGFKERCGDICLKHIKEDFSSDGGYNEHSIGYWYGAALAEMTSRVVILSRINNYDLLDDEGFQCLDKTFDIFSYLVFSKDFTITIGDNSGVRIPEIARLGCIMTGNKNCKAIMEERYTEAEIPNFYSNNDVGFVIARNRRENPTGYIMSAKRDSGTSGHNHMDMLSLNLCFNGEWFIDEPYAGVLYNKHKMFSPQRGYHYNMQSHNSVMCFSRPIQPDECYHYRWGVYKPDTIIDEVDENEDGSYVQAHHYGYTFCAHTRTVLFSNKKKIFIQDHVGRANRMEGYHRQIWNLEPGVEVEKVDDTTLILSKNGICVAVLWNNVKNIEVFKQTDVLSPIFPDEKIGYTIYVHFTFDENETNVDVTSHVYLNTLFVELDGEFDLEKEKSVLEQVSHNIEEDKIKSLDLF